MATKNGTTPAELIEKIYDVFADAKKDLVKVLKKAPAEADAQVVVGKKLANIFELDAKETVSRGSLEKLLSAIDTELLPKIKDNENQIIAAFGKAPHISIDDTLETLYHPKWMLKHQYADRTNIVTTRFNEMINYISDAGNNIFKAEEIVPTLRTKLQEMAVVVDKALATQGTADKEGVVHHTVGSELTDFLNWRPDVSQNSLQNLKHNLGEAEKYLEKNEAKLSKKFTGEYVGNVNSLIVNTLKEAAEKKIKPSTLLNENFFDQTHFHLAGEPSGFGKISVKILNATEKAKDFFKGKKTSATASSTAPTATAVIENSAEGQGAAPGVRISNWFKKTFSFGEKDVPATAEEADKLAASAKAPFGQRVKGFFKNPVKSVKSLFGGTPAPVTATTPVTDSTPPITPPTGDTPPITPPTGDTPPITPPTGDTPPITPPTGDTPPITPPTGDTPPITPPTGDTPPITPTVEDIEKKIENEGEGWLKRVGKTLEENKTTAIVGGILLASAAGYGVYRATHAEKEDARATQTTNAPLPFPPR